MDAITVNAPPFTGCLFLPTFEPLYLILVGSLVFETYAIAFILIKCIPLALKRRTKSPLSTVLVTDGLICHITIVTFQLFDIIITFTGPISLSLPVIIAYPITALAGVACNRLLIRLQSESLIPELDISTCSGDN